MGATQIPPGSALAVDHPQKRKRATGPRRLGYAKGGWIKGAIKHPGALHRDLGVPQGKPIPAEKLAAAAKRHDKKGQRARLAQTLKKMHGYSRGGKVKRPAGPRRLSYANGG